MDTNYIIFDNFLSVEEQIKSLEVLFNRVSSNNNTKILFDKNPTLIPFNYKFPIMDINEQEVFLKECQKHNMFDELPKHYQEKIYLCEKVNFYNQKFLSYLADSGITEGQFQSKDAATKLDIFYDFLFSNKMDIGILEL